MKTAVSTQSFDQENPPHTAAVHKFAGGGFISVLRMPNLADAWEMVLVVEVLRLELHGRDSYVAILNGNGGFTGLVRSSRPGG